jgi:hypothetical protein
MSIHGIGMDGCYSAKRIPSFETGKLLAVAPIESRPNVEMVGVDIASKEVGSCRIRTAHQTVTGKDG